MEFLIFISHTAAGCLRYAVGLLLISRLLPSERPGKKEMYALLAGMTAVSALSFAAGLLNFYQAALETVLLTVCAVRLLRTDTRLSLFISIYYETAVSLWRFLFAAWIGLLSRPPALPDVRTKSGLPALLLFHLLLAALAWYFLKHPDISGQTAFRPASGIAAAGLLAVVALSEQALPGITDDMLDTWTILAVIFLMSVLLFHMNRQYEVEKELARLKSEQAQWLERDYNALNNAYAVHARLFHDVHNHIGALRSLLLHEKTAEALDYLDQLQAPVREMTDTVWTGDETADYLINSKRVSAEENGIRYEVQVEFPRRTNLRSADLCAVLGNLLDNALEAAKQVPKDQDPCIRLTIRRIHQMLVIKVENPFVTAPVEENGRLKTSKGEKGIHGWGLRSAQTAAARYDGLLQTSCTEHTFRAVATLCFQGRSAPSDSR